MAGSPKRQEDWYGVSNTPRVDLTQEGKDEIGMGFWVGCFNLFTAHRMRRRCFRTRQSTEWNCDGDQFDC
jgi:hypothetical protein